MVGSDCVRPYNCDSCYELSALNECRFSTEAIAKSMVIASYVQGFNNNGLSVTYRVAENLRDTLDK